MRIVRLKIDNWKNFRSVELSFQRRAFFVGPNASGKSNLLDALRFLRDLCLVDGGGLQAAVSGRGGMSAIRCLSARKHPDIGIEVELAENGDRVWTYTLKFGGKARNGRAFIREEVVTLSDGGHTRCLLSRPGDDDEEDQERLTETALEQTSANKDFREIAGFLRTIRYLHVVPQIIRDPARSGDAAEGPFGGDLLRRINDTPKKVREARIRRMSEALRIAVPQMVDLQLAIDKSGTPHLKAKYDHWRPRGAWQGEDQFSDGTLRLLGLIWALMEKGGPILLEEPELSLHPAVVSRLPRMMAKATAENKSDRVSSPPIRRTFSRMRASGSTRCSCLSRHPRAPGLSPAPN